MSISLHLISHCFSNDKRSTMTHYCRIGGEFSSLFASYISVLFTQCKFSHRTQHSCCGSAFLMYYNGVLVALNTPLFENKFWSEI